MYSYIVNRHCTLNRQGRTCDSGAWIASVCGRLKKINIHTFEFNFDDVRCSGTLS